MESKSIGDNVPRSNKKLTTEEFITKARLVHGDKYDYSKTEYINAKTKVCIICPKHGEFWQIPDVHLRPNGCPKCKQDTLHNIKIKSKEKWVNECNIIHHNKYDYSKVEYTGTHNKVCIICPEHGEFWQEAKLHLLGSGCPKCSQKHQYSTDEWIKLANDVHNNKYDYSKVEYISAHKKVCIICPIHGEFWQTPSSHVNGHSGCPLCNSSELENIIRKFLSDQNIVFDEQKEFEWLNTYKGRPKLDFFLPDYNIGIECQGVQHFQQTWFGGINGKRHSYHLIENEMERDTRKRKLCEEHGIKILYYTNVILDEYPYEVITDLDGLIRKIMG